MKIKFCELFRSVQGEGLYTGIPAIFVRFSGCNKRCQWKNGSCDTKFSSFQAFDYEDLEVKEIFEKIKELKCKNVIITGGEPCLQKEGLVELVKILKENNYFIGMESNGSILVSELVDILDFFSISPKLPSSSNKTFELDKIIISAYIKKLPIDKYQIKFVIDTIDIEKDIKDIKQLLEEIKAPEKMNLILQPEGLTEDLFEYAKRCAILAEYFACNNYFEWLEKYNWRVMLQNHRIMWNNQRRK